MQPVDLPLKDPWQVGYFAAMFPVPPLIIQQQPSEFKEARARQIREEREIIQTARSRPYTKRRRRWPKGSLQPRAIEEQAIANFMENPPSRDELDFEVFMMELGATISAMNEADNILNSQNETINGDEGDAAQKEEDEGSAVRVL